MSNAREILAFRNQLQLWLTAEQILTVAWGALSVAAGEAIDKGWTGDELARWAYSSLAGDPPESAGAVVLTTVRQMATEEPPRDLTPQPRHMGAIRQEQAIARASASANPSHWAGMIKSKARERFAADMAGLLRTPPSETGTGGA